MAGISCTKYQTENGRESFHKITRRMELWLDLMWEVGALFSAHVWTEWSIRAWRLPWFSFALKYLPSLQKGENVSIIVWGRKNKVIARYFDCWTTALMEAKSLRRRMPHWSHTTSSCRHVTIAPANVIGWLRCSSRHYANQGTNDALKYQSSRL